MGLQFRMGSVVGGILSCVLPGSAMAGAQEIVRLKLQPEGWSERIGHYTPQRVEMGAARPAAIQRVPGDASHAVFGELPFRGTGGASGLMVMLDETPGRAARLLVDANDNRDLTDDPPAEWREKRVSAPDGREYLHYTGHVSLPLRAVPGTPKVRLGLYRFDASDPTNRQHAGALFCYADYGYDGTLNIGGAAYRAALADDAACGFVSSSGESKAPACALFIDLDSDGRFAVDRERFDPGKPLEILGGLFEVTRLSPGGEQFIWTTRRAAAKRGSEQPGTEAAKSFEARTLEGKPVRFPGDFKGKLVLLDFWATWCRPCIAEVPTLVQAHEKFAESGFTILGISLDGRAAMEKLPDFVQRNKMNWPHICEGQGWSSPLATLYGVRSIPRAYLVDGDSGAILATGSELRGPNLARTIEAALKRRSTPAHAP